MGFIPNEADRQLDVGEDETQPLLPRRAPSLPARYFESIRAAEEALPDYGATRAKRRKTVGFGRDSGSPFLGEDMLVDERRKHLATVEAHDIMDEIEESSPSPMSSPYVGWRRSSTRSTPLRIPTQSNGDKASEMAVEDEESAMTESTFLLRKSGTGLMYRDRKRRRSAPLSLAERRTSASSQQSRPRPWTGVKRWWNGDGGDKGKGTSRDGNT